MSVYSLPCTLSSKLDLIRSLDLCVDVYGSVDHTSAQRLVCLSLVFQDKRVLNSIIAVPHFIGMSCLHSEADCLTYLKMFTQNLVLKKLTFVITHFSYPVV